MKRTKKLFLFALLLVSTICITKIKAVDNDIVNAIKNRGNGSDINTYSGVTIGGKIDSAYGFALSAQKGTTVTFSGQQAIPSNIRGYFANPSDGGAASECINKPGGDGETLATTGYSAYYSNIGIYNDKIVDVKATVVDFQAAQEDNEFNGRFKDNNNQVVHASLMRFGAGLNINVDNVRYVKIKFEFFEHGTNNPISVKGNTTYYDVDAMQGIIMHDGNKGIHIAHNHNTLRVNSALGGKYTFSNYSGNINDQNKEYCFSETFEGSSITRTLTFSAYENGGWDYGSGFMAFSGDTVVPTELQKPSKTVSKDVVKKGEEYTYTISQKVNQTLSEYYLKSFKIEDTLESVLDVDQSNVGIKDSSGADVSSNFDISVSGQKITIAAKSSYVSSADFYGKTYNITIKTKIKSNANLNSYKVGNEYIIPNHATTIYKDYNNNEKSDNSDIVTVTYRNYTLTVNHIDKNTGEDVTENATKIETKEYGDSYNTSPLSNSTTPRLPAGYKLSGTPDNASGTITDNTLVIYEYEKYKGNVITKYIEQGTTTEIASRSTQQKTYGENYTTERKTITNYEFVRDSGNTSGTFLIDEDGGTITVVYEYKKKQAGLLVEYIEEGTNRKLSNDVTRTVYYGDTYTTTSANDIPQNYTLVAEPTNKNGVVDDTSVVNGQIKVTYWYRKKNPNIDPDITKNGTNKITSPTDRVSYNISYDTTFTDVIGDATITLVDTLPYKIDVTQSDIAGGTYDDNTKTITWTQTTPVNSYENPKVTITKNITVVFKDIDATKRSMTNKIEQNTVVGDKSVKTTGTHITEIEIKGKITVKHIDKDTGADLTDPITTTDLVGKSYTSEEKTFEGYRLVKKPESENFNYTVADQLAKYEYEKIKLNVTTRVNGGGGTITGDEVVEYGKDSTKDNIKIVAQDGYVIEKIKINGVETTIPSNQTSMTVSNFKKMTEDKLVEVSFSKKTVINVPKTSSKSKLIIIGLLMLSIISALIYVYSRENEYTLKELFSKK